MGYHIWLYVTFTLFFLFEHFYTCFFAGIFSITHVPPLTEEQLTRKPALPLKDSKHSRVLPGVLTWSVLNTTGDLLLLQGFHFGIDSYFIPLLQDETLVHCSLNSWMMQH